MRYRVVVDRDLCQSHGVCESEAPAVFRVPKAEQVQLLDATPPPGERRAVELAVRYCPTHALSIVEEH